MDSVLNWLWQGCVVAVAWFVMLRTLERARANTRCLVCWAAMLLILLLPALSLLQSTAASAVTPGTGSVIVSLPDAWWTSAHVILAAWIAWASIEVVRFAVAIRAIRGARSGSREFPEQVQSILPQWRRARSTGRRARLVLSDSVTTAAVLGWGAPLIAVAPSLITALDADELDRVLIHEWAHVQRRDDVSNVLLVLVRIVAGWHPALWWIDRRVHVEREIACDERTISITGSPKSYAECLLKLAALRGMRTIETAPAMLASTGLRARVIKILSRRPSLAPVWSHGIAAGIVTALCLLSAGLGGFRLVDASALTVPQTAVSTYSVVPEIPLTAAVPMLSSRAPSLQSPQGRPPPASPKPASNAATPDPPPPAPTAAPSIPVDPIGTGEAGVQSAVAVADTSAPLTPPKPPDATAERPQSAWALAAGGGSALGRKSRNAGVATAGLFSRFGRRVAGVF